MSKSSSLSGWLTENGLSLPLNVDIGVWTCLADTLSGVTVLELTIPDEAASMPIGSYAVLAVESTSVAVVVQDGGKWISTQPMLLRLDVCSDLVRPLEGNGLVTIDFSAAVTVAGLLEFASEAISVELPGLRIGDLEVRLSSPQLVLGKSSTVAITADSVEIRLADDSLVSPGLQVIAEKFSFVDGCVALTAHLKTNYKGFSFGYSCRTTEVSIVVENNEIIALSTDVSFLVDTPNEFQASFKCGRSGWSCSLNSKLVLSSDMGKCSILAITIIGEKLEMIGRLTLPFDSNVVQEAAASFSLTACTYSPPRVAKRRSGPSVAHA